MPTTIKWGFEKLRENLRIPSLEESTLAARRSKVVETLDGEMRVLDSFLTGAYSRQTIVSPLPKATVDILVVFDSRHYEPDGQAALLENVKAILKKTYPQTPHVSKNGQAVTIRFQEYKIDVIPAFVRDSGGFLIPDGIAKRWIATDPRRHEQIWSDADKAHKRDLVPVMQMIRGWNNQHDRLLRSFHLETLVLRILDGIEIADFPSGVRYVFDKARIAVHDSIHDPAGYGGDITEYLTPEAKADVMPELETAYRRAVEAEQWEFEGKIWQSYILWQLIFGDYFPLYV